MTNKKIIKNLIAHIFLDVPLVDSPKIPSSQGNHKSIHSLDNIMPVP